MKKVTHWNNIYAKNPGKHVGWYEEKPEVSLAFIESCNLNADACIFVAGAGTTNLISFLLKKGFTNIIANDISPISLQILESNLGVKAASVQFVVDDLTRPKQLTTISPVEIWVDRAVLHFFLDNKAIANYFNLLKNKVVSGGYVLIATFSIEGAKKCSGLPIKPYDSESLLDYLGEEFTLLQNRLVSHYTPSGDERPYHYALFKRK